MLHLKRLEDLIARLERAAVQQVWMDWRYSKWDDKTGERQQINLQQFRALEKADELEGRPHYERRACADISGWIVGLCTIPGAALTTPANIIGVTENFMGFLDVQRNWQFANISDKLPKNEDGTYKQLECALILLNCIRQGQLAFTFGGTTYTPQGHVGPVRDPFIGGGPV